MNQLILGEAVENLARLKAGQVQLTVTSPPFDDLFGLGERFCFEPLAQELFRVTSPGGIVCWQVRDRVIDGSETGTSSEQQLFFRDIGFTLHQTLIVGTTSYTRPERTRYYRTSSQVFVMSKGRPQTINLLHDRPNVCPDKRIRGAIRDEEGNIVNFSHRNKQRADLGIRGDIWLYHTGLWHTSADREAFLHPALMLEPLAEDLILSYSKIGDLVLDPLNGVGTTTKMARLNSRRYLGIEVNPRWHEIAVQRMAKAEIAYQLRLDKWLVGAA